MKKYILTVLLALFLCAVNAQVISGTIRWEENVDFSIQTGYEYANIL